MMASKTNELPVTRKGILYLPCVLQRLTDLNPEVRTERYANAVTSAGLRQSVLHNVSMILNSSSHPTDGDLRGDDAVEDSVLGMGLADFCGVSYSRERREKLKHDILHQLAVFEPRLDKTRTEVVISADQGREAHGELQLSITGLISVEPLKEEFAFRAKLDLESGAALVEEA